MSPLRRRKAAIEPREVWLILCDGNTERDYLRSFKARSMIELKIEICSGGPEKMVQQALRRQRERPGGFDQLCCVLDVDDRDVQIQRARAKAQLRSYNWLRLAISNPCIELWALLHFQERTAWISSKETQRLFGQHWPGYLPAKRLPSDELRPREKDAIARARKLTPGENPSTGIPDLIEALLAKGRSRD